MFLMDRSRNKENPTVSGRCFQAKICYYVGLSQESVLFLCNWSAKDCKSPQSKAHIGAQVVYFTTAYEYYILVKGANWDI